ncbi:MAG: SDR family oxidoreductase [Pseudomonadota bacterium]|nr:SDR family oxidoreductase [Pseudomonadota bacterium]
MIKNQKVIITAGASGIGLETLKTFVAAGAKVAICDIDQGALEDVRAQYPDVFSNYCDVSDASQTESFIQSAASQLDGIDTLINNAGVGGPTARIEDITSAEWNKCLSVCLGAQFHCSRASVNFLKQSSNASIVNLSSAAGRMGFALRTPYAAAKWGVIGLTKSLAIELGEYNIRVNAVLPGVVSGARQEKVLREKAASKNITYEEMEKQALSYSSIKNYVSAADIANQIFFLSGETGRMISGQAISVCGDLKMLS